MTKDNYGRSIGSLTDYSYISNELPPDVDHEHDDNDDNTEENRQQTREQANEQIIQTGTVVTKNGDITIHSLTIIGQIEGHYALPAQNKTTKYEHIIPLLVSVEESPEIDGLLILLNTVGGDVEAGLAIAEMIASMKKPTVSLVLGGGHSIGVPLAICAKRSFIVPSATMTIHPVRTNGLVIGAAQSYTYFTRMQERINKFIIRHSGIKEDDLNNFMFNTDELSTDIGSIIEGEQAIKHGLINQIGGLSDALSSLRKMAGRKKKQGPST